MSPQTEVPISIATGQSQSTSATSPARRAAPVSRAMRSGSAASSASSSAGGGHGVEKQGPPAKVAGASVPTSAAASTTTGKGRFSRNSAAKARPATAHGTRPFSARRATRSSASTTSTSTAHFSP